MPKYYVGLEEIASYYVTVDAENEDEAGEKAEEIFVQSDSFVEFPCEVHHREVSNVELIPAADAPRCQVSAIPC